MDVTDLILNRFFPGESTQTLWDHCPNKMLWEAIPASDALRIDYETVAFVTQDSKSIYILNEPLPAIYSKKEPDFKHIAPSDISKILPDWNSTYRAYPLYIFDDVFSWMIVLTAENTSSGSELCVLVQTN